MRQCITQYPTGQGLVSAPAPVIRRGLIRAVDEEPVRRSFSGSRRRTGVHMDTITRLLIDAGKACLAFHNENIRGLRRTRRVEVDEIWAFIYCKEVK